MRLFRCTIILGLAASGALAAATTQARERAEAEEAEEPADDAEEPAADGEEGGEEDTKEPAAAEETEGDGAVAAKATVGAEAAAVGKPEESNGDEGDGDAEPEDEPCAVCLSGYIIPGFGLRVRPDALPRDRLEHGFFGTAGLVATGKPADHWTGIVHLVLGAAHSAFQKKLGVLTDVEIGATVVETRSYLTKLYIEEATVAFDPIDWFGAKAGVMRIPFTLQAQSANSALMFPERSGPNEVFLTGSDIGLLAYSNIGDGIFTPSIGVFHGNSLGLTFDFVDASEVVLAARVDVNPFGSFPFDEGGVQEGDFRLGAGFGFLYRPATLYDRSTGYEFTSIHDLRMAASLRMAVAGLYVGAEYLRRQQVDDFTSRPQVADGAYAQLSYYWHLAEPVALEPIARVGFVGEDQAFDPRLTGWIDAGMNFYPAADAERPNAVRLALQYLGERRFTEQEEAHGGMVSARLIF